MGQFPRRGTARRHGALDVIARHVVMLIAMIAAGLLAGCAGIPQDDRYQTHDGGRSNTRAEAPPDFIVIPSEAS